MSNRDRKHIGELTEIRSTAYHEAAHAVAAYVLGVRILRKGISIIAENDSYGRISMSRFIGGNPEALATGRQKNMAEKRAIALLAGMHGQKRYMPSSVESYHGASDLHSIESCLSYFVKSPRELRCWMALLDVQASDLVKLHWHTIRKLACKLLEQHVMSGPVTAFISAAMAKPTDLQRQISVEPAVISCAGNGSCTNSLSPTMGL